MEGGLLNLLVWCNSIEINVFFCLIDPLRQVFLPNLGKDSLGLGRELLLMLLDQEVCGCEDSFHTNGLILGWVKIGLRDVRRAWRSVSTFLRAALNGLKLDSCRAKISLTSLLNSTFVLARVSIDVLALILTNTLNWERERERMKKTEEE